LAHANEQKPPFWARVFRPISKTTSTPVHSAKTGTPAMYGKPIYTAVSGEPTTQSQRMGEVTRNVASTVGNVVTLKPLRDKLSSKPRHGSAYQTVPKSAIKKPSLKLFSKPEPERPRTMGEWMMQERPK
jgi:hypothetical protein